MESVVSLAASSTVPAGIYTTITHSGHEVASPEVLSEAHDVCYKELAPDAPSQRLRDDQLVSSRCFVILSQNVCMCMVSLFLFLAFSGGAEWLFMGFCFSFCIIIIVVVIHTSSLPVFSPTAVLSGHMDHTADYLSSYTNPAHRPRLVPSVNCLQAAASPCGKRSKAFTWLD